MLANSKFWGPLKEKLDAITEDNLFIVFLATLGFPTVEAILLKIITSMNFHWVLAVAFSLVIFFHISAVVFLLRKDKKGGPRCLANAIELEETFAQTKKELERRDMAYRMVRKAFQSLNKQTCSITVSRFKAPSETGICSQPFCTSLEPIIKEFVDNIYVVFGVLGTHFTLELYLCDGEIATIGENAAPMAQGFRVEYYKTSHIDLSGPSSLLRSSPARLCYEACKPLQHHINELKYCYFNQDTNEILPEVYFRRFAAYPLNPACSTGNQIGVLVLTSMQDEPFADDVLEIMAFVASMISSFVYRYNECVNNRVWYQALKAKEPVGPSDDIKDDPDAGANAK